MERLEAVVLNYKNVFDSDFGRIDAEFFKSNYIILENKITKINYNKINDIANVTDGEHGSPELDENSGIMYLSGHNIKENFIDFENVRFCSEKLHLKNLRASVKKNSILMSIVGTVGKCSIVNVDVLANTDRNVATIKDINKKYNPFYMSVFLNSLYGKYQTERFSTGNVQPLLNLSQVKCIIVPLFTNNFQEKIENLVLLNDKKRQDSKLAYSQAENVLLRELDLQPYDNESAKNIEHYLNEHNQTYAIDDLLQGNQDIEPNVLDEADYWTDRLNQLENIEKYKPENYLEKEKIHQEIEKVIVKLGQIIKLKTSLSDMASQHNQAVANVNQLREAQKQNINIKSFAASFGTSGRLDAEYYQPKYDFIVDKIKSYKNGYEILNAFIENYSTGFPYKSETYTNEGIPLIRINNISKGQLNLSNATNIPDTDFNLSEKDIAVENDILISMSGTIGNSCRVPKDIKAVVNQRIMRFTPKNYDSEVLSLLINSIIGYLQLERIGTGGVQTNISATDIKEIFIPKLQTDKQQQIAKLIEESFYLKKQSEHLLEVAKRAVEIAIEENEETAMKYIEINELL